MDYMTHNARTTGAETASMPCIRTLADRIRASTPRAQQRAETLTPAAYAADLVRLWGVRRALQMCEAGKGAHPYLSPEACYYDEAGRTIERCVAVSKS
jgi:hypothetical protein